MDPQNSQKTTGLPVSSRLPRATPATSSLSQPRTPQEVVGEDISSIGPSGIVGIYRSNSKPKKKTVVIPLIENQFSASYKDTTSPSPQSDERVTTEVKQELTEAQLEAQMKKDPYAGIYGLIAPTIPEKRSTATSNQAPLLSRSRPKGWREIEDEDERLRYELEARPETDQASFDRVPIEDFGKAMLLGMGWNPGVNDGAKVVELKRRPERLGLGAIPKQPPKDPKKGIATHSLDRKATGGSLTSMSPYLSEGTAVEIISGPHEGMSGRIRRLSSDEREYIVELSNDELVRVRTREVAPRVGGANSKKRSPESSYQDQPSAKKVYQSAEVVGNHRHDSYTPPPLEDISSRRKEEPLWVTPYIRVKVQSKRFRDGRFYCKKGVIEDIISGTRCILRLDDGQVVDDIHQEDLETVIPPIGGRIMVVRGPECGTRGVLKEKDNSREVVFVQIEDELDIVKFNMDDVSQYVD